MTLQPGVEPQKTHPWVAMALAACFLASAVKASDCLSSGTAREVAAIGAERQAFNRAIAEMDLERIAGVLHANIILVTGAASAVYEGREAQLAVWRDDCEIEPAC